MLVLRCLRLSLYIRRLTIPFIRVFCAAFFSLFLFLSLLCLCLPLSLFGVGFLPLSGTNCNSALLIHEGHDDVNENFRWATAHITGVKRTDVAVGPNSPNTSLCSLKPPWVRVFSCCLAAGTEVGSSQEEGSHCCPSIEFSWAVLVWPPICCSCSSLPLCRA